MKKFIAAFILAMSATTLTTLPASAATATEIIAKGKVVAFHSSGHFNTILIVVYKGAIFRCIVSSDPLVKGARCRNRKNR